MPAPDNYRDFWLVVNKYRLKIKIQAPLTTEYEHIFSKNLCEKLCQGYVLRSEK